MAFRAPARRRDKPKKDPSKVKHTCPNCGLNVWGKRGIRVVCEACDELLEAELDPNAPTVAAAVLARVRAG